MVVLFVGALVAAFALVVLLIGRGAAIASGPRALDAPLTLHSESRARNELIRRRAVIVSLIHNLRLDHDTGKIADADYEKTLKRLEGEAVRVGRSLRDLEGEEVDVEAARREIEPLSAVSRPEVAT